MELKWRFENNSTVRYECSRSSERRNRQETLRFGLNLAITDVNDGVATIQVTIDQADEGMSEVVGKSFEMKLRETGEIVELKGLKDVQRYGNDEMRKLLDAAFPRMPKEAVVQGGFWKTENTLSVHMLGDVPAKSMSKVTAVKGKVVDFQTKTKLDVDKAKGHMEIWDAGAVGKGTWDAESGRLTEYTTEINITAEAHGQAVEMVVATTLKWAPSKGQKPDDK
jgi:hypothetical protein